MRRRLRQRLFLFVCLFVFFCFLGRYAFMGQDIFIGVEKFRILGGQGLEYWGAKGGAKFPAGT